MKAIVLSCDRYHPFANHMIARYGAIWRNHPFTFRIPWQLNQPTAEWGPTEPIQTGPGIRETVLGLLEDISDDTFVYWCIDDKFPIWLDAAAISAAHAFLLSDSAKHIDALLLHRAGNHCKAKNLLTTKTTLSEGITAIERANYKHIWLHQFTRAKVLRHLFSAFPEVLFAAKKMDSLKNQIAKPLDHRLYVSEHSYCLFHESTSRGKITRNCLDSFQSMEMNVPVWAIPLRPRWLDLSKRS